MYNHSNFRGPRRLVAVSRCTVLMSTFNHHHFAVQYLRVSGILLPQNKIASISSDSDALDGAVFSNSTVHLILSYAKSMAF